jgi:hypothetical protein
VDQERGSCHAEDFYEVRVDASPAVKERPDAHKTEEDRAKKVGNSLQNFPMQSGGAEALRLACTYAAEIRLGVCAPLHDALFVVAKIQDEAKALADLRACMDRASRDLIGVAVPIEMFVTRYPDRFIPDDKPMAITVWNKMVKALEIAEHEAKKSAAGLAETAGQPEPSMTLVPALACRDCGHGRESHCQPGTTHLHMMRSSTSAPAHIAAICSSGTDIPCPALA